MNLTKEIIETVEQLTEMRYEDPLFVGEESVPVSNGIVKSLPTLTNLTASQDASVTSFPLRS